MEVRNKNEGYINPQGSKSTQTFAKANEQVDELWPFAGSEANKQWIGLIVEQKAR